MTGWRIFVLVVAALVLQACIPTYKTTYDYSPPQTAQGRRCVSECQSTQTYCRKTCTAEISACKYQSRLEAQLEYERYVTRQKAAGKKVERSVSSFESYGACKLETCTNACENDFRICYATCGGEVTQNTFCTSGCDEVGGVGAAPLQTRALQIKPVYSSPRQNYNQRNEEEEEDEDEDDGRSYRDTARSGNASLCRKGAKLEVLSEGDWYEARVTGPLDSRGRCPVSYIGYDSDYDEEVSPRNLRRVSR